MQSQESKNHIGQRYLEHQLSWFGQRYCEDDDITFLDEEKNKKKFIEFLESYATSKTQIFHKDQPTFESKFTELYNVAFGSEDHNNRNYGINKMNKILKKQNSNYEIKSKSSYWVVCKCNTEPNDSLQQE